MPMVPSAMFLRFSQSKKDDAGTKQAGQLHHKLWETIAEEVIKGSS